MSEYEIIQFKNDNVELTVNVSPSEDNAGLTKEQIAILFDRDRSVISKHVNNILKKKNSMIQRVHFLHRSKNRGTEK